MLSPPQKYAAGGLLALSLHQILINRTNPLSSIFDENSYEPDVINSKFVDPNLWLQHYSHLLRIIFRSPSHSMHMPVMCLIVIYILVFHFSTCDIRNNVLYKHSNFDIHLSVHTFMYIDVFMIRTLDIEEKAWPGLEAAFRTDSSSQNVRAVCSFFPITYNFRM